MLTAEFQVKVQNGKIQIPENLQQEFEGIEGVKVILIKPVASNTGGDLIQELLDHPLEIEDFLPASREKLCDRSINYR